MSCHSVFFVLETHFQRATTYVLNTSYRFSRKVDCDEYGSLKSLFGKDERKATLEEYS
jgi:hypothetical protein